MTDLLRSYFYELRNENARNKKQQETEQREKQFDDKVKAEAEVDKKKLNAELESGIDWDDYKPPLIKESHVEKASQEKSSVILEFDREQQITKNNNTCELPDNAHLVVRKTAIEDFKNNEKIYVEEVEDIRSSLTKPDKKELSEGDIIKLKSLCKFIHELTIAKKKDPGFNAQYMKCNEDQLLSALKKWERKRHEKRVWERLSKLSNSKLFWRSKKRKVICKALPQGKQNENESNFLK